MSAPGRKRPRVYHGLTHTHLAVVQVSVGPCRTLTARWISR